MLPLWLKLCIWIGVGGLAMAAMEPWSKIVHGRLWHRKLWSVHYTHHVVPRRGFEWNDLLASSHVPVAIALIYYASVTESSVSREIILAIGMGMTAFGAIYAIFHEGVCHERLPVSFLLRWKWVQEIRKAHLVHHHTDGPPYGLMLGRRELETFRRSGVTLSDEGRRPEVVAREKARALSGSSER